MLEELQDIEMNEQEENSLAEKLLVGLGGVVLLLSAMCTYLV